MGFVDRYGPWAVVLGASQGLGEAFAVGAAARGLNVVVVARRRDCWDKWPTEIPRSTTSRLGPYRSISPIRTSWGTFVRRPRDSTSASSSTTPLASTRVKVEDQPVDSMRSMVAINCLGPLMVCERFGGPMIRRGSGGIVLMSSGAGLAGCPYNASYAASKAFDLVLGESLWWECQLGLAPPCSPDLAPPEREGSRNLPR